MTRIISLIGLFVGFSSTVLAQQPPPVLAIFSIENRSRTLNAQDVDNLSDYLSTKMGERGLFQIIPRSEIRKRLLGQKQESYKACYDETCQVELGRELAAEQSLSVKISQVGSNCLLQANLYDLKRAASIKSASAKRSCKVDDLITGVEELTAKLDGSWKPPETAAVAPRVKPRREPKTELVTSPKARPEIIQPAPAREKSIWAALAWSLLPGGGLYYTDHGGWSFVYGTLISLGLTGTVVFSLADNGEMATPVLFITLGFYGVSMLHASLAALVWEDPEEVAAVRNFRPIDQEEHAVTGTALVFPVWQTRF